MKICSKCKESLSLDSFSRKGAGYQSMCKTCNKAYYKEYYRINPAEKERLSKRRKQRVKEFREFIREAKNVPCADCGNQYPYYVMQFDHLGDKEFTISSAANLHSLAKVKVEIAKCEVVCANCHAERTWMRSNPYGSATNRLGV